MEEVAAAYSYEVEKTRFALQFFDNRCLDVWKLRIDCNLVEGFPEEQELAAV